MKWTSAVDHDRLNGDEFERQISINLFDIRIMHRTTRLNGAQAHATFIPHSHCSFQLNLEQMLEINSTAATHIGSMATENK